MRRLREHQRVSLEVDRPSASIECLVLAVDGNEATLEPVDRGQVVLVPTAGKDALLTFEFRSQHVALRGRARRDEAANDLRFSVTDRVTVPQRRRYARVDVALRLVLTPPDGEPIVTRTRDVSADGLLADVLLPSSQENGRIRLEMPGNAEPIECEASIVRHVGGGTAMRYASIAPADRERLKQFVAARKREILANLRSQSS
jgi:c-di-GMP-binding flagellar brake protein YcgR